MDWLPVVLEIFVQAVIELGPFLCSAMQQPASRTERQALPVPDHWKCPSEAQLAEFLRRSDARRSAGASQPATLADLADFLRQSDLSAIASQSETGAGFLTHGSPHPLWDRELDA
jgi:hypothetical protein